MGLFLLTTMTATAFLSICVDWLFAAKSLNSLIYIGLIQYELPGTALKFFAK
jgi:hypothetical protein